MEAPINLPNDQKKAIGARLADIGIGGYVEIGAEQPTVSLFYTRKPPDSDHAFLEPGVVLLFSSEILKGLCELSDIGAGMRAFWTCKKKGYGRLYAQCARAGVAQKPRGEGKRARLSMKVGCRATVTAGPLTPRTNAVLFHRITEESKKTLESLDAEQSVFCVIQSVQKEHSGHIPPASTGENLVLSRSVETIAHPQICSALQSFLRICTGGPGITSQGFSISI